LHETKKKISGALLGIKRPETLKPHAIKIQVTDLELDTKTIYNSICAAAKALNINHSRISDYFSRNGIKSNLIKEDMFLVYQK
jgi:hypothetical protein